MFRLMSKTALIAFALSSPAAAALEDPDVYATEVADASMATQAASPAAICVPPETQYIPNFIRSPDGTIVGINYTIVEYLC